MNAPSIPASSLPPSSSGTSLPPVEHALDIYLLRHAIAHPAKPGQHDAERELSNKGQEQCKTVAQFIKKHGLPVDHILASPLVRTQQTAHLLAKHLHDKAAPNKQKVPLPQSAQWLSIHTSVEEQQEHLTALLQLGLNHVMLVGHEPDFSTLLAQLLQTHSGAMKVRKASLTWLRFYLTATGWRPQLRMSIPCDVM